MSRSLSRFGCAYRARRRRAFTLLEAILAIGLIILLMSGVLGFYLTTLRARETGGRIARDAMLSHSVLNRMVDEIRQTSDIVPGDGIAFHGTHDRITIIRASVPEAYVYERIETMTTDLAPAQMDIRRITYELVWDTELKDAEGISICHGLLRTEQKTFDPNPRFVVQTDEPTDPEEEPQPNTPPIETELVAPEIKYLRFEYFDGAEWRDRWQNTPETAAAEGAPPAEGGALPEDVPDVSGDTGGSLPQAVRITVGQVRVAPEDEEFNITQLRQMDERQKKQLYHPDRFTTTVYLLQTDQSQLSSRKFGSKNNDDLMMGGEQ